MSQQKIFLWIAVFVGAGFFISAISSILLPFVVGILVAYFLDPAADRIEKLGVSRGIAAIGIIIIFFVAAIIVASLLLPVLSEQLMNLITKIPDYVSSFNGKLGALITNILREADPDSVEKMKSVAADFSGHMLKFIGTFVKNMWQSGVAILNLLSLIFISPIVAFYLLRDWDRIVAKVDGWLPKKHAKTIRQQVKLMDKTISGYIHGQLNVCMLLGVFYAIGLSLVGLEFGLFIGLATGILSFIPYVGMLFGTVVGLAVAFFQFGDWYHVLLVAGVFFVGQFLEGNFVAPKLVGKAVGLHPVWIIFALLAGGALFGFVGILLSVPVAGILGVLTRFALNKYLNSPQYKGKVARKRTRG